MTMFAGARRAPIELKGEEADPADIVTKALDDFKASLEEREKKASDRLDKLEARMNRPNGKFESTDDKSEPDLQRKAFLSFCRKGVERMAADETKALTAGDNGMLSPPLFVSELLKTLVIMSPIRQYARVVTVGAGSAKYPKRTSEAQAQWVAEGAPRPSVQPTYVQVEIPNYEIACDVPVSNQLLEDNYIDLEGELIADFAESFAKSEGAAFVSGTGTGQPTGLLTSTGITNVVNTGNATGLPATNPTDPSDLLITLFHYLPAVVAQNGIWCMNRNTLATFRKVKNSMGEYVVMDGLTNGAPPTILGRPICEAIDMPDIGAGNVPVLFGDLKTAYRITDRIGVSVLRDPYTQASSGNVVFHCRRRVGADVVLGDRMVKLLVSA